MIFVWGAEESAFHKSAFVMIRANLMKARSKCRVLNENLVKFHLSLARRKVEQASRVKSSQSQEFPSAQEVLIFRY